MQTVLGPDGRLRPMWRLALFVPLVPCLLYLQRQLLVPLVVIVFMRYVDKRPLSSLGFHRHRGGLKSIGVGLLLGVGLTGMIFTIESLLGWLDVKGFAWNSRPGAFYAFIGAALHMSFVAVSEEMVTRGYILQNLKEWLGIRSAVIGSSILFGAGHLLNPTGTEWARYVIPLTITLAGIMLAMGYLVYRSLWLPIALHFSWNLSLYDVFGLAGAPAESATFLVTDVKGPALWVGLPDTSFGPEVGILGVVAMLFGIWVLSTARCRGQAANQIDENSEVRR